MQGTSTSRADLINVAGPRVKNASWSVSAAQSAMHKFHRTISNKANLIPSTPWLPSHALSGLATAPPCRATAPAQLTW